MGLTHDTHTKDSSRPKSQQATTFRKSGYDRITTRLGTTESNATNPYVKPSGSQVQISKLLQQDNIKKIVLPPSDLRLKNNESIFMQENDDST
jgi:hypothetical protein